MSNLKTKEKMKKNYIKPEAEIEVFQNEFDLLDLSQGMDNNANGNGESTNSTQSIIIDNTQTGLVETAKGNSLWGFEEDFDEEYD